MGAAKGKQNEVKSWAWLSGANILWDIQQNPKEWFKEGNDANNKLKRLGGPGEVAKGTFSNNKQSQ